MTDIGEAAEVVAAAQRVLGIGEEAGVPLGLFGGAAVAMTCPSAHRPPLRRTYGDVDLITLSSQRPAVSEAFEAAGLLPDQAFNSVHAADRLWFSDDGRKIEVYFDRISMCHTLELEDRLAAAGGPLPAADLLLLKLQVVKLTDKDLQDAAALLADHELGPGGIDDAALAGFLASDWGWWRTATESLGRVADWARAEIGPDPGDPALAAVPERVAALQEAIEAADKSRRWRLRARVGERMRWYEEPDEFEE